MIHSEPVCREHAEHVLRVISGWGRVEVLTLELVQVSLLEDETEPDTRPTFADILSQYRADDRFSLNNLPTLLGIAMEDILLLVSDRPVSMSSAERALQNLTAVTGTTYSLDDVHIHLKEDAP